MELIQLGAIYIPTTSFNISWGSIENAATTLKPRRKENTEQQQQQQLNTHQQYSMNNKTLSDLKGTQIDWHLKEMMITTTGFTLASAISGPSKIVSDDDDDS